MTSSRRAKDLARQRVARLSARQQAARRRRVQVISASAVVLVLALAGGLIYAFVPSSSHRTKPAALSTKASPTAAASTGASPAAAGCQYTAQPHTTGGRFVGLPPKTKATGHPVASIVTNRGTLTVALNASKAPCTVNSFEFLAAKHYFDKTPCHRLTTGSGLYVLQCGDPTGTGSGGPGYSFADENLTGATYPAGTVAMANAGKNTNGSQFFIVYKNSQLPASYTPFGTVTAGLPVVTGVAAKGANPAGDGKPVEPVTIETFRVTG